MTYRLELMRHADERGGYWLTADEFRAWLATHEGHATVGVARKPCDCPLARAIIDLTGADSVDVDEYSVTINGEFMHTHPTWARRFVGYVDSLDSRFDTEHENIMRGAAEHALEDALLAD